MRAGRQTETDMHIPTHSEACTHTQTHTQSNLVLNWSWQTFLRSPSLSFFFSLLLSHTPSISLNYFSSPAISLSLSVPPPPIVLPHPPSPSLQPMPNGFEQGSPPTSHLPSERNSIGLEANQSQQVLSCDWIWPRLAGWGGWPERAWFDFSSAPMKVDLMYYCYGHGSACLCV